MLRLHAEGASNREIAEAIGICHGSVGAWLDDAGLEGRGGYGSRAKRKRSTAPRQATVIADAAAAAAAIGNITRSAPPQDRGQAYEHMQGRLHQISKLADTLARGVPGGESPAATLAAVVRLERDLAEGLADLIPPEQIDPANDPANLEAAAEVRAKLQRLVEVAEDQFRCASCGNSPYPQRPAKIREPNEPEKKEPSQ
jgi:hypothetical protein